MTLKYEKELCTEPECLRVQKYKGLCQYHYSRSYAAAKLLLECVVNDCMDGQYQQLLCRKHWAASVKERNTNKCKVLDCKNIARHFKDSYCHAHYSRLRKRGTLDVSVPVIPHKRPSTSNTFKEFAEFERLIKFAGPDDCWIWQGPQRGGYGRFNFENRKYSAHIETYKNFGFDVPEGYELDHLCRVRLCCNPTHLQVVTTSENVRRMSLFWSQYDPCSVVDCGLQGIARGLCAKHYREQFDHINGGEAGSAYTESEEVYLMRRIRYMEDGCWDWMGPILTTRNIALPVLTISGQRATAYRYIYMKERGVQLTSEQTLDHLCRNRVCVNPEHLEVVTHDENVRRRWEADRARIKQLEEGDEVA